MTDANSSKQPRDTPERLVAQELLARAEATLSHVQEVLGVEDLSTVLPGAHERRDDASGELINRDLTDAEREELISRAKEFGFASPDDLRPSEVGLVHGYVAFIEGGQLHKVASEVRAAFDPEAMPGALVIGGSRREVKNPAERTMAAGLCGISEKELPATEYEITDLLARSLPDLRSDEEVLPIHYDIHNSHVVSQVESEDQAGQFVRIGYVGETTIIVMRIDRNDYTDADGNPKYDKQPNSGQVVGIIDNGLTILGDADTPLALASSGTYAPTRSLRVARQSLGSSRMLKFTAYGTETVGAVRKAVDPEDNWVAPVKQVPEELGGMYKEARLLRQALDEN